MLLIFSLFVVLGIASIVSPGLYELQSHDELDKLVTSTPITVVFFYANWCGFCRAVMPEWKRLAAELDSEPRVSVAQVDAIANPEMSRRHGVTAYPSFKASCSSIPMTPENIVDTPVMSAK